jgi:hypothetical protein
MKGIAMTTNEGMLREAVLKAASETGNENGSGKWALLDGLAMFVSMANLPLGIVLMLTGVVGGVVEGSAAGVRNLSESKMPDEWLGQVALANGISQEGLAFLARCVAKNGCVTVADALEWCDIEEDQAKKKAQLADNETLGAVALLQRARSECGALLEPSALDRAVDALKSVSKAAPDALAIATRLLNLGSVKSKEMTKQL